MTDNDYGHEARELELYLMNDYNVYAAYYLPACRMLAKHHKRGTFDRERGIRGMRYAVDAAAKQYNLEHGSMSTKWSDLFPRGTRDAVAAELVDQFLAELREGNDFKS
jgi:hypothetical protein